MTRRPPFRAEHVGSLLRPERLRSAYRRFASGELSVPDFRAVQDDCVRDVIALQESTGIRGVTDGEFRRASYWSHFVATVEGLGVRPAIFDFHTSEAGSSEAFLAPFVEGKVARTRPVSGDEFDFLRAETKETPKLTLPSPSTMHFWGSRAGIDGAYGGSRAAFFEDLAGVYRAELADLAARGATYVQLDEVPLAMLCDDTVRARVQELGEDAEELVDDYVRLTHACIRDRPSGMTIGMHLCRGNFKGKWLSEGGYEPVAERVFGELAVDAYFLEYDTPRAGDFAPLRFLAPGKTAVLGLITTKSPELEDLDRLARRIDEASRIVPLEQLAISPQCGFSSAVSGNPVTEDDQRRKLALVVELADRVWGG